ncbi:capsular biosynthesis protein, partial [Escherichia coli]
YQRIIVDVSAVSQSQDIELISRVVDGVVFVVQAGAASVETLRAALAKVDANQEVVMGAVLNLVEEKNLQTKESLRSLNITTDELMNTTGRL